MKNLILSGIFIIMFTLVGSQAQAQVNTDATVEANATILGSLSLGTITNLEFGNILASAGATTVTPANGALIPITNSVANQAIDFSFTTDDNLANGAETLPLSFAPADFQADLSNDDGSALAALSTAPTVDTSTPGSITVNGSFTPTATTSALGFGGTVTPATNQVAGTYSRTITVTLSYQ